MASPGWDASGAVVDAVISYLSSNLDAELTLIESECANDLVMPRPAHYGVFDSVEDQIDTGFVTVVARTRTLSAEGGNEWTGGYSTSFVRFLVQVILARVNTHSETEWNRILWRMETAVLRVLVYRAAGFGNAPKFGPILPDGPSVMVYDDATDPSGKRVTRVTIPLTIQVQDVLPV